MRRDELVDLCAFLTVAEQQSFTRAAVKLGTSQSALSHTIRRQPLAAFTLLGRRAAPPSEGITRPRLAAVSSEGA
jgi:hypothetical protein